jgi:hypothetical protein
MDSRGRKNLEDVVIVMDGQAKLLQIVLALHSSGRLSRRLYGRQQQRYENSNDRNDDQQLDQTKSMFRNVPHVAIQRTRS